MFLLVHVVYTWFKDTVAIHAPESDSIHRFLKTIYTVYIIYNIMAVGTVLKVAGTMIFVCIVYIKLNFSNNTKYFKIMLYLEASSEYFRIPALIR